MGIGAIIRPKFLLMIAGAYLLFAGITGVTALTFGMPQWADGLLGIVVIGVSFLIK